MPRCVNCGNEIDNYQEKTFSQLCSDCVRHSKNNATYKLLEEVIQYRNETEGGLLLLAIVCFILGLFLFLIFHPLLILLSIMGAILIIFSLFHNSHL